MKETSLVTVALLLAAFATLVRQSGLSQPPPRKHNLMPVPASVQFQGERLKIAASFTVAVDGHNDARLQSAIHRATRRLEGRTGLEFSRAPAAERSAAALLIRCHGPGLSVPSVGEDESYSLVVAERQAVLDAWTVVGALRGLETFLQLLEGDREGYFIPAVSIQDKPRFPWRGLLIDVGRHFEPVEVLKRNLDAMAAVKLNVLHWHLTDDQGFRVECTRFPKLHQLGSDGLYYTQDQMREVTAYAGERGIRVMPEFDMPGHCTSWLVGYPELGSAPGSHQIERKAGIFESVLDPTREETYRFLEGFLTEISALFPDDYIHIGGDENEGAQWSRNPQIQAFMKEKAIADNHALQAYFNQRLAQILKKLGKKMIGWEEILHPDLPGDTVIQSWRGPASLAEAARRGYKGILSSGYYIDLMYPASQHYGVDPVAANNNLTDEQLARILGGETTMWGEWVGPETIDSRIWPRAAAIAERLWSPREVADVEDMYRRLAALSIQLEELGLTHEKNVDMILRRMARTREIGPLRTLVSVVEPVKEYNRGRAHPSTTLMPLTRLVDAARPDSETARRVADMVDGLLSDAPALQRNREGIQEILTAWRDARLGLEAIIDRSPILREAAPLAADLEEIGTAGLESLSFLSGEPAPRDDWRKAKLQMLQRAAKPKAEVEFAIISPVTKLIILAAELQRLKSVSPADWKQRVSALAAEKNR